MAVLLRRLPFFKTPFEVAVGQDAVRVKAYQIIVWVSLGLQREAWDPRSLRFPAILDTGHTHNFSIQRRHLLKWAGYHPDALALLGQLRERGKRLPLHAASLWLYPNVPGRVESRTDQPPYRLTLTDGIAVYPDDGSDYPRLPLLGLRALAANHLHLAVRGWRRSVTLRTRRWWFFE